LSTFISRAFVAEKVVADELLLVVDVLFRSVRHHHVVQALKRGARRLRALADELQVVLEAAFPRQIPVQLRVVQACDLLHAAQSNFATLH
jgi:hypothetical protein